MNAMEAGILSTVMLLSACACLYGCISAAAHRLWRALAAHGLLPLAVLAARLPSGGDMPPWPWTALAVLLLAATAAALILQLRWSQRHVSQVSIKTSCDHLPCALCFAQENGRVCLMNLKMDELSHRITGGALLNANAFWAAVEQQPVVTLENGQVWRFERTAMTLDGQRGYQIIGTDETERTRLNEALAEDNRRLAAMNQRLRAYSRQVQAAVREKETLRAKARIHDELGHMLLKTRQFLDDGRGSAEEIACAWHQSIRLLLGEEDDPAPEDTLGQLLQAAEAIGVRIDLAGDLPSGGTENAALVEAAIHECLTNLVRHAGGTQLLVAGDKTEEGWRIRLCNDGAPPAGPIAEGVGLSSLRARVEAVGGAMAVAHAPRFLLTVILPEETEALL